VRNGWNGERHVCLPDLSRKYEAATWKVTSVVYRTLLSADQKNVAPLLRFLRNAVNQGIYNRMNHLLSTNPGKCVVRNQQRRHSMHPAP
jgi:hypothetical protein